MSRLIRVAIATTTGRDEVGLPSIDLCQSEYHKSHHDYQGRRHGQVEYLKAHQRRHLPVITAKLWYYRQVNQFQQTVKLHHEPLYPSALETASSEPLFHATLTSYNL